METDTRYGCFDVKLSCPHCGNPIPVNGPVRRLTCRTCLKPVSVAVEALAEFLKDFEEEYEGLEKGTGRGGTMMGMGGNWDYAAYRTAPGCPDCKVPLPEVATGTDGQVACPKCGRGWETYPAPGWLVAQVASATQCVAPVREGSPELKAPGVESAEPVAMSCPSCGGGLTVTETSERVFKCTYCGSEVLMPDALWLRLHPVPVAEEWWVRFEGATPQERQSACRKEDEKAEAADLRRWKPPPRRRKPSRAIFLFAGVLAVLYGLIAAGLLAAAVVLALRGMPPEAIGDELGSVVGGIAVASIIGFSLLAAFSDEISFRIGPERQCRAALAALAERHGWKHEGAEIRNYIGSTEGKLHGIDVELHPNDDYAVEAEVDRGPFYLKTEPPGYPSDDLQRFTTGDPAFDQRFPIRYAKPAVAEAIAGGDASSLEPFRWFTRRWGDRILCMQVDWSSVQVHLSPGGVERNFGSRYLEPDEMEPLLEDTATLARALDAVTLGRTPELPD